MTSRLAIVWFSAFIVVAGTANADVVYLNDSNISVALGASMSSEPFQNRTTAASLASVIDAPSASASELHNQSTHVWVSGGTLELDFNFGSEYDLFTFHFWNYHSESYDVDDIDLKFFDSSMSLIGTIQNVSPALGNGTGSDSSPIFAEDHSLAFPTGIQFLNVVLSGSNTQVDFNNIGFTGELSVVPEPGCLLLMLLAALIFAAAKGRGKGGRKGDITQRQRCQEPLLT